MVQAKDGAELREKGSDMRMIRVLVLLGILAPVAGCGARSPRAVSDAAAAACRIEEVALCPVPANLRGIAISPDGCRIAFVTAGDDKWHVVLDGQPGPQYDEVLRGTPVFGPDGKRMAYGAKRGEKWFVVLDGKDGPPFEASEIVWK